MQKIKDGLYKKKKIQPLLLEAISGQKSDYGLKESDDKEAKNYKKYNEFVTNKLDPFVKKKTVKRKFNTVPHYGFGPPALSSFYTA